MKNLNNKTLLTAVTCAWLLTAAVFVIARPSSVLPNGQAASPAAPGFTTTFALR